MGLGKDKRVDASLLAQSKWVDGVAMVRLVDAQARLLEEFRRGVVTFKVAVMMRCPHALNGYCTKSSDATGLYPFCVGQCLSEALGLVLVEFEGLSDGK